MFVSWRNTYLTIWPAPIPNPSNPSSRNLASPKKTTTPALRISLPKELFDYHCGGGVLSHQIMNLPPPPSPFHSGLPPRPFPRNGPSLFPGAAGGRGGVGTVGCTHSAHPGLVRDVFGTCSGRTEQDAGARAGPVPGASGMPRGVPRVTTQLKFPLPCLFSLAVAASRFRRRCRSTTST